MIRILEMGSSALLASLMRLHVPSENDIEIMRFVSCSFSVKIKTTTMPLYLMPIPIQLVRSHGAINRFK